MAKYFTRLDLTEIGVGRHAAPPGPLEIVERNHKVRSRPARARPSRLGTPKLGYAASNAAGGIDVGPTPSIVGPVPNKFWPTRPSEIQDGRSHSPLEVPHRRLPSVATRLYGILMLRLRIVGACRSLRSSPATLPPMSPTSPTPYASGENYVSDHALMASWSHGMPYTYASAACPPKICISRYSS